jgi:hypothetical protein
MKNFSNFNEIEHKLGIFIEKDEVYIKPIDCDVEVNFIFFNFYPFNLRN